MKQFEKFFDVIGEILAVALVVVWTLLIIHSNWNFLPAEVYNVFLMIKEYGGLLLIAVVGFEAMCKRNFLFRWIFLAMIALIVIFLFFPGTYQGLINLINTGA